MYPMIRFLSGLASARRASRIGALDPHVSTHRCMPWDIDPWMELNNGRTLTLYDLGRIPMAVRMGLTDVLKREGWGFTVAGSSVRYRRRIKVMQKFTEVSRMVGWDDRFVYMEQSMWSRGDCFNQILLRVAVVGGGSGRKGIVPPAEVIRAMGQDIVSPPLPEWVQAWIAAEGTRPWPPVLPPVPAAERTRDLPA